jgi:hypothetical protein
MTTVQRIFRDLRKKGELSSSQNNYVKTSSGQSDQWPEKEAYMMFYHTHLVIFCEED